MQQKDLSSINFDKPIAQPKTQAEGEQWQEKNRTWWENNPMRYDWKDKINCKEFSKEFFVEIDKRFFYDAGKYMPWEKIPFDALIDFDSLPDKDVLEIGVGNGSHAQLLAEHAKTYTGIDITEYAVKSTSERMKTFNLPKATTILMDAENMNFQDNTFDFIWTWGVIHHSANTEQILKEIKRVLRPGGTAITMVYHRSFWNYYIMIGFFVGILRGKLFKTRSLHKLVQMNTDGAIARYYTIREWYFLCKQYFHIKNIYIYGSKAEILPIPGGNFKKFLMSFFPDNISRLLTNTLKMGGFLVSILGKKG